LLTTQQAPCHRLAGHNFLGYYNYLGDKRGRNAGIGGQPKYIFSVQLSRWRDEKIWFFKRMRGEAPHNFFIGSCAAQVDE
jgi:hypothetical protein